LVGGAVALSPFRWEFSMPAQLMTLYAFTLAVCERLMADIRQEEMERQPAKGVNTPAWILGHLAICTDFALKLLGQPTRLPASWHEEFGPGSSPLPEKHPYPSRDELLSALAAGHAAVVAALPSADAKAMAGPNPLVALPFVVQTLPTVGDLLAHLISTHEAAHLGHLSNWRRQMGRAPLF
jgi:uncharacterized damage-inducible protein DinB